jgi:hypothetical protein
LYKYLTAENVIETYKTSRQWTEGLTNNFTEYERIARNKPHPSTPKELPKTTDGTTASIIRKTPKRIIQQLPTGKIVSDTNDWLSIVASFIYRNRILRNANEGYDLIQKCWMVVEKFLTFGSCPTYAPFIERQGYFCTDLRLPYWADVFLQPGKISDEDSNFIFLRTWWQSKDIDALIASQSKLSKKTEKSWNVEALNEVKDYVTTKEERAKTPAEKEQQVDAKGGIELITGFQRGVDAEFFTFHVGSGKIVRTKKNKDPRGNIPLTFAYGDIDGSNPFGRGIIDLVGSLQNLIDGEMQLYQFNRALMLAPPVIKRGNFPKSRVKWVPNSIIDVGTDGNAGVEAIKIDTTAHASFPNNYGLMKSQLINLVSSPDTSISSEVGNPGFSKTPAGVKQLQANLSIDDNYVRKQFETWFAKWSETAVNLYFAERNGIEELQLDKETALELLKLAEEGKFNPQLLSPDFKIRINYSTATPALKFEIDASTSKMQDDVQQLQSLEGLTQLLDKSPSLQGLVPKNKQIALWNAIVNNSGVEDPEKLTVTDKELQESMQAMSDQTQETVSISYKDLPEDVKRQQEQKLGFQPSQESSPAQQAVDVQKTQAMQAGQPQEQGMTPEMMMQADQQAHQQAMDVARLQIDSQPEIPQPPTEQIQLNGEEKELVNLLSKMSADTRQIGQALALLRSGKPLEEVLQIVKIAKPKEASSGRRPNAK